MPATDAQLRANAKYKKKLKHLSLDFYPADSDIWDHLEAQENKRGYIKQLIREDMKKSLGNSK